MKPYTKAECRAFIRAYLVAALWSSHDWRSEPDSENYDPDAGEMMHDSYKPEDLQPNNRADVRADCFAFLRETLEHGIDLRELGDNTQWYSMSQHGHDFWLTRSGHGAGFWDRGYGKVGDILSELAKLQGSRDCLDNGEFFVIE